MVSFWQLTILVLIVALSILGGVMIGAYSVYRAKRESHESFIGGPRKGEVFSIDTFDDVQVEDKELPDSLKSRATDFMAQFGAK